MFEEQWREVFFFCPLWALFPLGQANRLFAFLVNWHLGKRIVVREVRWPISEREKIIKYTERKSILFH
jgi:hypothetical protein